MMISTLVKSSLNQFSSTLGFNEIAIHEINFSDYSNIKQPKKNYSLASVMTYNFKEVTFSWCLATIGPKLSLLLGVG